MLMGKLAWGCCSGTGWVLGGEQLRCASVVIIVIVVVIATIFFFLLCSIKMPLSQPANLVPPPVPSPIPLRGSEQVAVWGSAACRVKQCHRAVRGYLDSQERSWDSPSGNSGWGGSPAATPWWEQPPGLVPSSGTSCPMCAMEPTGEQWNCCCLCWAVPACKPVKGSCWLWLVIALLALFYACGL